MNHTYTQMLLVILNLIYLMMIKENIFNMPSIDDKDQKMLDEMVNNFIKEMYEESNKNKNIDNNTD